MYITCKGINLWFLIICRLCKMTASVLLFIANGIQMAHTLSFLSQKKNMRKHTTKISSILGNKWRWLCKLGPNTLLCSSSKKIGSGFVSQENLWTKLELSIPTTCKLMVNRGDHLDFGRYAESMYAQLLRLVGRSFLFCGILFYDIN